MSEQENTTNADGQPKADSVRLSAGLVGIFCLLLAMANAIAMAFCGVTGKETLMGNYMTNTQIWIAASWIIRKIDEQKMSN